MTSSDGSPPSSGRDPVLVFLSIFGPISVSIYGLVLGGHNGPDYLSVRWFLGWLLVNDIDGVPGRLHSLTVRPFFNEFLMGVLSAAGPWWLPTLIVGALHGAIPALLYHICRMLSPRMNKGVAALASVLSMATPLVSVHIGRENGHLLAALCLIAAIQKVIGSAEKVPYGQAAFLLNLALFLKYSAIFSVVMVTLFVLVSLSPNVALKFARAFAAYLWIFTLVHSILRWPSLESREIVLQPLSVSLGWFVAAGLMLVFSYWPSHLVGARKSSPRYKIENVWRSESPIIFVFIFAGLLSLYSFTQIFGDVRFYTDSLGTIARRLLSNGLSVNPMGFGSDSLYDLEYQYFDMSKIVATVLLLAALGLLLSDRLKSQTNRQIPILFTLLPGSVLILVMAHYGYVRYSVEALLLLPVAAAVFGHSLAVRTRLKNLVVGLPLLLLALPISGLQEWRGYFVEGNDPRRGPLLSHVETGLLTGLVPVGSTVIFLDRNVSWIAPVVDRPDLTWWIGPVSPVDVGRSPAIMFFDPVEEEQLERIIREGWLLTDCQVLRFERISAGWCVISAA